MVVGMLKIQLFGRFSENSDIYGANDDISLRLNIARNNGVQAFIARDHYIYKVV
jgi:hypothetical protein